MGTARVPHWEQILAAAILAARDRPFVWGQHDCATWAFDLRRDLTGGPDHAALWRGRYRSAGGCHRVLRRLGREAEEAIDETLNQVLAAESISAGNFVDEDLRHLKERRLAVKYMIERQLERKG